MRRHMRDFNVNLQRRQFADESSRRRKEKARFRPAEQSLSLREAAHEALPYGSFSNNWMSVEIECFYPDNGIKLIPFSKSHSDGSIEAPDKDEYCDCEYPEECDGHKYNTREYIACFPFPRLGTLQKITKKLNHIGADTNDSCGLHVHLDVRHLSDLQFKIMVEKFHYFLPLLMVCSERHRWNNSYCKLGVGWNDRYYAINTTSRAKHDTLEIRIHHGSVNFDEISNWVKLLNWIKQLDYSAIATIDRIDSIEQFQSIGLPDDLALYIANCQANNAPFTEAIEYLNDNGGE